MAKSNITSPTVLAHKRYQRWTEEEILQALSELDVILEEPFTGSILDKHLVTFSNGVSKKSDLCSIFRGISNGQRVYQHTTETVNEQLAEFGAVLAEEYKGKVGKYHLITFSDGTTRNHVLASALAGKITCKRYTTETLNNKLAEFGATLAEEYKGDVVSKHWITFENGKTKYITPCTVLNGNSTGKLDTVGRYTTEIASEKLQALGLELMEPFKGSAEKRHKIKFECGHTHAVFLDKIFQGARCPECIDTGFNQTKSGYLYFIKVENGDGFVYKVGITNRSVYKRYYGERANYETLALFYSLDGSKVYQAEQSIRQAFKVLRYKGKSPFKRTGTSEMFIEDISSYREFLDVIDKLGLINVLDLPIAN